MDGQTGWDLKDVSPPLKNLIDKWGNVKSKVLIPGAGSGWEVSYLYEKGFTDIHICEWSSKAIEQFKNRMPSFPISNIHQLDFFELQGKFDWILEQTFFCALPVEKRAQYAAKMDQLLNSKGKLQGVLFDIDFQREGPPFGGSRREYEALFSSYFTIDVLETAKDSIAPRAGNELIFSFTKD